MTVDLAGIPGDPGGDGNADTVIVNGTPAADRIAITADAGAAVVSGRASILSVAHPETFDRLVVNGLAGVDAITVDPVVQQLLTLTVNPD